MLVYRIAPKEFNDENNCLQGYGGVLSEGRWHFSGAPIVYTASTRSLAMLERLVNDSREILKTDLSIVIIQIPDNLKLIRIVEGELYDGWDSNPYIPETQTLGSDFLSDKSAAVLQVPSSLCADEYNFIINPLHPDAKLIKCTDCSDFKYPLRLADKLK